MWYISSVGKYSTGGKKKKKRKKTEIFIDVNIVALHLSAKILLNN